jgi:hypothetical protein
MAKEWPTPAATVINDRESPESFNARAAKWAHKYHNSKPLTIVCKEWAAAWPTPGANDWKGSSKIGQRRFQLDEAAEQKYPLSPPDQKSETSGESSIHSSTPRSMAKTKRLSPLFVEWMMGLPLWWTLPCSFEWTD